MDNVVGVFAWIAIIAAVVHVSRLRKSAKAQQRMPVSGPSSGYRQTEVHPDLGAGLALGHAIAQINQGNQAAASHFGHIATAAYWAADGLTDSDDDDE